MYCDIPKFARCCFCFPLRYGILAFAYVNLIISTLILILTSIYAYHNMDSDRLQTVLPVNGTMMYVHVAVPITLCIVEIIFTVLLIVGAHLKNATYFKVYFWYSVVTVAMSLVTYVALMDDYWYFRIVEGLPLLLLGLVVHIYLLLLLWSELKKLQIGENFRFENNTELHNTVTPVAEVV